jgi:hypothetical protein
MWETIRWQILNANQIEVSPDQRSLAWKELIANVANNAPLEHTFRTMLKRVDLENFDYNTPIVYDLKYKNLLIFNERLKGALNRPVQFDASIINVRILHALLVFICVTFLCVILSMNIGTMKNNQFVDMIDK